MPFNFDKLIEQEVTFESGLKGKKIIVYGVNDTGKTKQLTKLPKPLLIMTESGGSAVNCPKIACDTWSQFKDIVNDMCNERNLAKRLEQCETIIVDTAENLVDLSERAICTQENVTDLSEITGKKNGYKMARNDFSMQIAKLTSKGYCVVFIAHEEKVEMEDEITGEKYTFVQPKGTSNEKSSMRMLRDLCDFCIYLQPQGIDPQTFETIPSKAICHRTKRVFARSRFDIQPFIDPFTANGLVDAVELAVKKSADESDVRIEAYMNRKSSYGKQDYIDMITPYLTALWEVCADDVQEIMYSELGEGAKLSDVDDNQIVALDNVYNRLVTKATMLGIEV